VQCRQPQADRASQAQGQLTGRQCPSGHGNDGLAAGWKWSESPAPWQPAGVDSRGSRTAHVPVDPLYTSHCQHQQLCIASKHL